MMELLIPTIGLREKIDIGLSQLNLSDNKLFRELYFDYENLILLLDNGTEVKTIVIKNPLDIDITDKKITTSLHKNLLRSFNTDSSNFFQKIINELVEYINNASINTVDTPIEVGSKIEHEKMLQALNVYFTKPIDYLSEFLSYIFNRSFNENINALITFNLSNLLTNEENILLHEELVRRQIYLIDICSNFEHYNDCKILSIDKDCCII